MIRFRVGVLLCALVATASVMAADSPPSKPTKLPTRVAPLSPEALVAATKAEQETYFRRLDICTQLRRIAAQTNDSKLEAESLRLEQLAETTLKQRLAKLGTKVDTRPAKPSLDQLERTLGSGVSVNPLSSTKALAGNSSITATAQASQFREVKP